MPDLDYIELFLTMLQSQKGFSGNTLAAYRNDLTQFSHYLNEAHGEALPSVASWSQVTRDNIISFLLYIKERQYAPTTVARKQAAIKSFFRYLVNEGITGANPGEELASPHVDRALPHTISSNEVERLVEKLNTGGTNLEALRDQAMMQLLYATGLRVGEMVALNKGDVNTQAGTISTTGRGKRRDVPIGSAQVAAALQAYLEKGREQLARAENAGVALADNIGGDEEALFLNHRGQRLTRQGFWLILKGYARSAGLGEVTPHTLRHSFAAQKLESGADVRELQKMLGHASLSTTQVYARMDQKRSEKKVTGGRTAREGK